MGATKVDYSWIVKEITARPLDTMPIRHLLRKHGNKDTYNTAAQLIYHLSKHYPLYEPAPGFYKILTRDDYDRYEEAHRKSYIEE